MNAWLKGLLVAAVTGAIGAIVPALQDPDHFNFTPDGVKKLAAMAAAAALVGVLLYLKQSPLAPAVEKKDAQV